MKPPFFGGPLPGVKQYDRPEKPKSIKELPRYLLTVIGGFFGRLFYIVRLVFEANPAILFLMAFLCVLTGLLPVAGAYITSALLSAIQALLTDGFAAPGGDLFTVLYELITGEFRAVFFLLIFQFIYMFLARITNRISGMVNTLAGDLVSNHIRMKIMHKAKTVDPSSFDRPDFYERLENANREAGMRPISILRATFEVCSVVISSISFIAVLATLSPWAPLLIILFSIPTACISMHYRTRTFRYMRHSSLERRKMNYFSSLVTDRNRVQENRIMNLSDTFIDTYRVTFKSYYQGIKRLILNEGMWHISAAFVSVLVNCALFLYIAYRVLLLGDPIGQYSLYTSALTGIATYVSTLIASTATIYEGTLFIDNLMVFMKEKPTVLPTVDPPEMPKKGEPHTVTFDNVSFRYPGSDREVLRNLSFTLRTGEKTVLVGLNGAGKTTLIKLLTRLYDPTSGTIYLDGKDLRTYDVTALHDLFGVLFQDFGKYAVSAGENIAYGDVSRPFDKESVISAAKRGNADEFITSLPHGYDTVLSRFFDEDGVDLSIGQWQKLSLARAYYKTSDIMILDEPTASLDALAEQEVFNQFAEMGDGRITVFVSHRLSGATLADNILVLEKGEIIESGNHSELMSQNGRYAELFTTQAKRYTEVKTGQDR